MPTGQPSTMPDKAPAKQSAPSAEQWVLFDFDGTLVRGDNGTRMIYAFARSRGWPIITMLLATPIVLPLVFFPPTKRLGASIYLWLSTVGMSKQQIKRCLKRLSKYTASHPERYRIDATWQCLQTHLAAGDKVVIVTGCWQKMAKMILAALGLKGVQVIGSRKKSWHGGYICQPHCYGKHKLICLAAHGVNPPWSYVYTDSASDRYLLKQANHPVLVRPTLYTLIRVRNTIGSDIEVIR